MIMLFFTTHLLLNHFKLSPLILKTVEVISNVLMNETHSVPLNFIFFVLSNVWQLNP